MSNIIKQIQNYFFDNIIIISMLYNPGQIKLINSIVECNIQNSIVIQLGDDVYIDLKEFTELGNKLYYIDSYYNKINTIENDELLNYLNNYVGYERSNGVILSAITAVKYFIDIYENSDFDINSIKRSLKNKEMLLAPGLLRMQKNNHLSNYIYVTEEYYNFNSGENDEVLIYSSNSAYLLSNYVYNNFVVYSSYEDDDINDSIQIILIFPNNINKIYDAYDIIHGLIQTFNGNNEKKVYYYFYNIDPSSEEWDSFIKEIRNKNIKFIFLLSIDPILHYIQPYLRSDQILFYAGNSVAESCYSNVITFGLIPNQLFYHVSNFLSKYKYESYYILYDELYPYNKYVQILEATLLDRYNDYKYIYDETNIYDLLIHIKKNIPIILIMAENKSNSIISLINTFNIDIIDNPIINIIHDISFNSTCDYSNTFFVSPYSQTDFRFSNYLDSSYQYSMVNHGSILGFYSYLSINFFLQTLNISSFNTQSFFDYVYDIVIDDYKIEKNNYLKHYFFFEKYIKKDEVIDYDLILIQIDPNPYNIYYNNNTLYICDFTTVGDGYEVKTKYIFALMSFTGYRSYIDYGLEETLTLALMEINSRSIIIFYF